MTTSTLPCGCNQYQKCGRDHSIERSPAGAENRLADIALVDRSTEPVFACLIDYEPDHSFSVPQANDLDKVFAVADIVDEGANTNDAIASALDMSPREGAYYASAAGYLGLISVDKSDGLNTYHLTGIGEASLHCDESDRAAMAVQMVRQVPEVQIMAEEGEEALRDSLAAADLTGETVARRSECIRSWMRATADSLDLASSIREASSLDRDRVEGAAAAAREQIAAARAPRKPEPTYAFCPSCFLALPAAGVCDECA